MQALYKNPADTQDAIQETRSGKYAGTLDMTDFNAFLGSIDNIK